MAAGSSLRPRKVLQQMHLSTSTPGRRRLAGRRKIPTPHGPGSVTISDGQDVAGSVTFHAGEHHLFGPTDQYLGSFKSRAAAVAALPKVSA
jgi:hypothetical protein